MPELPEVRNIARQIDRALRGATICGAEVRQPKCLNRPVGEWLEIVKGRRIDGAVSKGKWCDMALDSGAHLRLNLGMGGEFLLHEQGEEPPQKRRILLELDRGRRISVNFWWFGSLNAVMPGEAHGQFDALGIDALSGELTCEGFTEIFCRRKAAIKTLLLDQKLVCGIGNYYSHDLLFGAGLHPMRRACDLSREEFGRLYAVMRETLLSASVLRGADYERDIYNRPGEWSRRLVGYRAGEECPVCGTRIEEIKTGATTGFVCPHCQKTDGSKLVG